MICKQNNSRTKFSLCLYQRTKWEPSFRERFSWVLLIII